MQDGQVTDAWSSGTMFRGIELILKGRDPRDAWVFAQRICGVCTTVHALSSVRAVENALGIVIHDNARLIRDLIAGAQLVQDHVIHFYHLHALDWVDVTLALKADPGATSTLAQSISTYPKSSKTYFKGVQDRLQAFVNTGQLGLLTQLLQSGADFVWQVYIPDVLAVASFYKNWASIGAGLGNYMAYGDYASDTSERIDTYFFPNGLIIGKDLTNVQTVDQTQVKEYVTHSWYTYAEGDATGLHPWQGETNPNYTGLQPPFQLVSDHDKYSWLKAPRYNGQAVEVGPLARMLIAYAKGQSNVQQAVNGALGQLGVGPSALFSMLGRVAARAIEAQVMINQLPTWLAQLEDNMGRGNLDIHDNTLWDPSTWPSEAEGFGHHEAPRGSLGHWVRIKDGAIENYQAVVPSTCNAGPRDAEGQRGAYEAALIGTPVVDPARPVEILRTVHSFDPCLACAVHVVDPKGREYATVRVL